jgi:hypothetical protein
MCNIFSSLSSSDGQGRRDRRERMEYQKLLARGISPGPDHARSEARGLGGARGAPIKGSPFLGPLSCAWGPPSAPAGHQNIRVPLTMFFRGPRDPRHWPSLASTIIQHWIPPRRLSVSRSIQCSSKSFFAFNGENVSSSPLDCHP